MSKITLLLRDLPADRASRGASTLLTDEQWSEILAACDRGVSVKAIFAALSGTIEPFYRNAKALGIMISKRRKKLREAKK